MNNIRYQGELTEAEQLANLAYLTPTDHNSWKLHMDRKGMASIKVRAYKETLKCLDCDLSFKGHPAKCHFHHTEPEFKLHSIADMVSQGYHIADIEKELTKCIPLCDSCHTTEHHRLKGHKVLN